MDNGYLNRQAVDLVRSTMKDRGVTQVELAAAVGVAEPAISRALSGRQNLTLDTIQRYIDALGAVARLVVSEASDDEHTER